MTASSHATASAVRSARAGDLLPQRLLDHASVRRIEATALVIPGTGGLDGYLAQLEAARDRFSSWDGQLWVLAPDGEPMHCVAVVDRYGQVYEVSEAQDASGLPDVAALEEWFKFLATACPECGVLDDPSGRGWVP